ncbi:MAG: hypothetical protein R3Y35_13030 [Clostridia bacterium]
MKILLIVTSTIFIYCILSILLKVPKFGNKKAFKSSKEKTGLFTDIVDKIIYTVTPKIKLSVIKKREIQQLLTSANSKKTPEEFMAKTYVETVLPLFLIIIVVFIKPALSFVPIILSVYFYRKNYQLLNEDSLKRQREIETEMLKFVMYMSNALKSSRNVINCIEDYKRNFNTSLTEELTYTLAEMRTGNYEKALKNMEIRNNSESIRKLVRGIISSMKGDDMSQYFDNLGNELTAKWGETLKAQALKKKPEVQRLSYIMFAVAMVTVLIILAVALLSSATMIGGL